MSNATETASEVEALVSHLTGFQRDLLAAIPESPAHHHGDHPHGLAVKQTVTAWYGEEINHGRLYPNLDELVENGLVDVVEVNRRTNGYRLTDGGREALSVLGERCEVVG